MTPGRVSVTARALQRTVAAIAAGRLGVPVSDVSVRLVDDAGLLGIAVTGPLRLPPLRSPSRGLGAVSRVQAARQGIRSEVAAIAGSTVGTVTVSITRAIVIAEKRVR